MLPGPGTLSMMPSALKDLTHLLTQPLWVACFELSIQCDISSQGLGAAILQGGKPLAYANRTLTDTETRYITNKKEVLAVVFVLEKWHQYTFGHQVPIYLYHKPLESITKKPLEKAQVSPRHASLSSSLWHWGPVPKWQRNVSYG